jgi:uncharacterized SAM-binding protein YcdF (DUF218 family)
VNLSDKASNTYEEARSVSKWVNANAVKNIIVPTDIFHTRRVQWIFDKELNALGVNVSIYAIKQEKYSLDDWWSYKEGRVAFSSEVFKYLFYRIRY